MKFLACNRLPKGCLVTCKSESSIYKVQIGNNPSCKCENFCKTSGKEVCKHILWTYRNTCKVPENSYIIHQLSLTEIEVLLVLGNTIQRLSRNISVILKNITPPKSRKTIVEELLRKDARNQHAQIWHLRKKGKEKRNCAN